MQVNFVRAYVGTPRHGAAPYVFWHHDGKRYSTFANIFAVIASRADVAFRCHDLRHAFASRFLQAAGNVPALQAILGHRSIQVTCALLTWSPATCIRR